MTIWKSLYRSRRLSVWYIHVLNINFVLVLFIYFLHFHDLFYNDYYCCTTRIICDQCWQMIITCSNGEQYMYIIDLSLRKEYRYIHANIRKFKFIFAWKVKMKKKGGGGWGGESYAHDCRMRSYFENSYTDLRNM